MVPNARWIKVILVTVTAAALATAADAETFLPSDDAHISQHDPASAHGSWQHLCVRNAYGGGGPVWEVNTLVRFDLSSIPAGTPIPDASLHLFYFTYWDNSPAGHVLTLHRITGDWNEVTVTWSNRPTHHPLETAVAVVPGDVNQWMTWDVTDDVQLMVNGQLSNYGWSLMDPTYWGGPGIPLLGFRSKEYGYDAPYLEIPFATPTLPATWGAIKASFR